MAGLFVEQFEVGRVFDHEIRRTVTEADNVWFCTATYNPARIHIDAEYCATTEFGKPLVNSIFTLGLVIGLSVFPKPVFAGDTIRSRTTVIEKRNSRSRPDSGIVTFRHEGLNQRDEIVCSCTRQALMHRSPRP
jgi:acyl dehydratase